MENPSNNDEQSVNTQDTVSEKIRDYILKIPWFVLWNLSLLVGGIIFWLYFFQIGYFPDLTGDESVILLPLVAITCGSSILLMATILMAPSLFRWLILKPELEKKKPDSDLELKWYFLSIFLLYAAILITLYFSQSPWVLVILLSLAIILQILIYLDWKKIKQLPRQIEQFVIEIFHFVTQKNKNKQNVEQNIQQNGCIYVVAWVLSAFFSIFPLFFMATSIDQIEAGNSFEKPLLLLATSLFVLSVNYGFSYEQEKNTQDRSWLWFAIPLLPVLVILVIMKDPVFPKIAFNRFQFGSFTVDRLLLDEQGCEIIEGMGLTCEPVTKEKQCVKVKNQCYLDKIKILSRLGSDIMLEIEPKNAKTNFTSKFKIPKKNVLSWLTVEHKNQITNKNDDSTQAASDAKKTASE